MADTGSQTSPQGVFLKGKTITAGTVVHILGIPVRLVQDTNVEAAEGSLKILEERFVGATYQRNELDLPPLSPPPAPPTVAAGPKTRDVLDALREYHSEEEERKRAQRFKPQPTHPWFDSMDNRWLYPVGYEGPRPPFAPQAISDL